MQRFISINTAYFRGAGTLWPLTNSPAVKLPSSPDSTTTDVFGYTSCSLGVSGWHQQRNCLEPAKRRFFRRGLRSPRLRPAANLGNELYNSKQTGLRDQGPVCTKFLPPTIANGKVYVAGSFAVSAYGLASWVAVPSITPPGGPHQRRHRDHLLRHPRRADLLHHRQLRPDTFLASL